MSDPLRVAFVVEGPTDFIMLKEVVGRLLEGEDFVSEVLQPEMSEAFKVTAGLGGGWPGVCRWCLQAMEQGEGRLRDNPLFVFHDVVIIQLDADVAENTYEQGHIQDPYPGQPTLPFEADCPPPSATTNRLRSVVLRWIGEQDTPPQTVICTPSKALEAWVVVGLFPDDSVVGGEDFECRSQPEAILRGKPKRRRLVSGSSKKREMYLKYAGEFADNWNVVRGVCTEAARFDAEFRAVLESLSGS